MNDMQKAFKKMMDDPTPRNAGEWLKEIGDGFVVRIVVMTPSGGEIDCDGRKSDNFKAFKQSLRNKKKQTP